EPEIATNSPRSISRFTSCNAANSESPDWYTLRRLRSSMRAIESASKNPEAAALTLPLTTAPLLIRILAGDRHDDRVAFLECAAGDLGDATVGDAGRDLAWLRILPDEH